MILAQEAIKPHKALQSAFKRFACFRRGIAVFALKPFDGTINVYVEPAVVAPRLHGMRLKVNLRKAVDISVEQHGRSSQLGFKGCTGDWGRWVRRLRFACNRA